MKRRAISCEPGRRLIPLCHARIVGDDVGQTAEEGKYGLLGASRGCFAVPEME